MNKVQLLLNEVKLIQEIKKGHSVQSASEQIGITREAAYYLLKRLVLMGVVQRTGHKKNYQHKVADKPYVIVDRRSRAKTDEVNQEDEFLHASLGVKLDNEQLYYLKMHKHAKRSLIAKQLGVTKLQLNFLLIHLGNKG